MRPCRLHVMGASGSGTTTFGRALATAWSVPHADADDYFWVPTTPPYTTRRDVPERLRLMEEVFLGRDRWVVSGSFMGWGEPVLAHVDAVVFLSVDHQVRMDRLRRRERARYGADLEDGGPRAASYQEFIEWAGGYEDPGFDGRNRVRHEQWLSGLTCPVVRLDSSRSVADLVTELQDAPV